MVLLDLMKPYDNMDHGKPLQILEGYRMGLKIRGLLVEFWSLQEVVTPQNRFQGPQLQATRGTTQGELTSPKISNMALERMVQHWLSLKMEEGYAIHDGLRMAVVRIMDVFYADDVLIRLQEPEWIQGVINVLIRIFHRVGLIANAAKPNTTTFQPGENHTRMLEEAFIRRSTGEVAT